MIFNVSLCYKIAYQSGVFFILFDIYFFYCFRICSIYLHFFFFFQCTLVWCLDSHSLVPSFQRCVWGVTPPPQRRPPFKTNSIPPCLLVQSSGTATL